MLDRTVAYGLDFMFPTGDIAIGDSLALHGEFAKTVSDFLIEHASAPGGTLIDAGANIGAVCLPFAAARPDWRVLAIEPSRPIASILSANAYGNRLTNVEVVQAAAGAATGVIDFPAAHLGPTGNWGTMSMAREVKSRTKTLCVTLDEMAPVDTRLIKVDTEGMDHEVLKGSGRLLRETRPVWLVETDQGYPEVIEPVIATLLGEDYDVYWFYAPFVSAKPAKWRTPDQALRGDTNVVAMPKGSSNPWGLPPVTSPTQARPGSVSAYPYLARYGFTL